MAVHKIDGGPGGQNNHFPKKFVTLYASAACTEGFFVSIDGGDTTNGLGASCRNAEVGATSVTANALTFGVATHSAAAGEQVIVQTAGKYENAFVDAGCDEGLAMTGPLSGGTIGRAELLAAASFGPVIAVGLEADTAVTNYADVMIIDQGFF
tara:strand:- start:1395 stop:1853 length:459 start_codon:yes stop_codon:yes gene_type:complete